MCMFQIFTYNICLFFMFLFKKSVEKEISLIYYYLSSWCFCGNRTKQHKCSNSEGNIYNQDSKIL